MPAKVARAARERKGRAVVVLTYGDGLARVFADSGAVVVQATAARRPSAGAG